MGSAYFLITGQKACAGSKSIAGVAKIGPGAELIRLEAGNACFRGLWRVAVSHCVESVGNGGEELARRDDSAASFRAIDSPSLRF